MSDEHLNFTRYDKAKLFVAFVGVQLAMCSGLVNNLAVSLFLAAMGNLFVFCMVAVAIMERQDVEKGKVTKC